MIKAPALEETRSGKYICPECGKEYSYNWIRRHLIQKHGYEYLEDTGVVYKPNLEQGEISE